MGKKNFNPDTNELISKLMNDAKLTTLQRRNITQVVNTGNPLPELECEKKQKSKRSYSSPKGVTSRSYGGVKVLTEEERQKLYERGPYIPPPSKNMEEEKQKLITKMEKIIIPERKIPKEIIL